MGYLVDSSDVEEIVELIKSSGITSVSDEAAEVDAPGVWVQVTGYTFRTAARGTYTLNAQVVCLAPDSSPRKARHALNELLNKVLTVVTPAGPVTARTAVIPGGEPAVLPALAFPLNARITLTQEP